MSNRFSSSGDSRYTSRDRDRDRSPPSRFERRGSISGPIRNSDNSYRPGESTSSSRDVSGVPRGPSGRGASPYIPKSRGYIGRDARDTRDVRDTRDIRDARDTRDTRDARDTRDTRDNQFYRRNDDRDFSRRDTDRRSPPSRNRSRTPPQTRDFRDARDNRDASLRSLDTSRVTRDSRDNGPSSAISAASDAGAASNTYRGGFRARGREWDRASSRRNFDERDSSRARSRSRDRWDRDHDRGRDYDRDSRRDDDARDRESERVRRDPPGRPDSRNSVVSQPASTTSAIISDRREPPRPPAFSTETPRRSSIVQTSIRPELSRGVSQQQHIPSSPIQYPQVPEFGVARPSAGSSDSSRPIQPSGPISDVSPNTQKYNVDPTVIAPKGPKADLAGQHPSIAKAFPPAFAGQSSTSRRFDHSTQAIAGPTGPRFGSAATVTGNPSQLPAAQNRHATWTSPDLMTRTAPISATSQESRPSDVRIPTGPKAEMSQASRGIPGTANSPASRWGFPNRQLSQQHKPSIMQSMHHKKEHDYPSRPSASSPIKDVRPGSRSSTMGEISARRISSDMTAARRMTLSPGAAPSAIQGLRHDEPDDEDDDDAIEDDEDDDEVGELNQDDFEAQEAKHKSDIEALEKKLAPSPERNPKILTAVETIHVYASAIEDYRNGYVPIPQAAEEEKSGHPVKSASPTTKTQPASMLTPPAEATVVKMEDQQSKVEELPVSKISIKDLPYLDTDPLTPASYEFSDGEAEEADLCFRVRRKLAIDETEDDHLRDNYAELYREWREEVDAIDEDNARQEALATRAATPISALGTETNGTPVPESGRRSTRNATEMDLERVIKESAEEAQAAEMAQVPMDLSVEPDMTREADIPEMLTEEDQELFVFEDVNNQIPNLADDMTTETVQDHPVFKAYDYIPEDDDFDSDDQERFKEAYARFPKQWGFIANHMNDAAANFDYAEDEKPREPRWRDFHQCIMHYYQTKKQAKPAYKLLPGKRPRKSKKSGAGRRAANQRSSMLGNGEEGSVRMSDTGRPKRAAAPSFNDKEKREAEALAQKTAAKEKKSTAVANKPNGDGTGEKTTAKRSRKKAEGEKPTKRGAKATTLAPNLGSVTNAEQMPDVQVGDVSRLRDHLEGAQLLAELHNYASANTQPPPATFSGGSQNETWRVDPRVQAPGQPMQISGSTIVPQPPVIMSVLESGMSQRGPPLAPQNGAFAVRQMSPQLATTQPGNNQNPSSTSSTGRAPGATTSYWSVQEQNLFVELVKRYGKDWAAIGQSMPYKTETMIKNNFERGGKGNGQDLAAKARLEEYAAEAERQMILHGRPPPPELPPQIVPQSGSAPRRRGAASTSQRTLAPTPDQAPETMMQGIAAGLTESRIPIGGPVSSGSPNSRIVAARQPLAPSTTMSEILGNGRQPVSAAPTSRAQLNVSQAQAQTSPYGVTLDNERMRAMQSGYRDAVPQLQSLQSKRPRSISEQDRHIQEQPQKRQQALSLEEFNNAAAALHEQQHRSMHRSDSQQSHEYRQPITQSIHPSSARITSNPEEIDRYRKQGGSPPQYPSSSQYVQAAASHPGSMASVMGGSRPLTTSPGMRPQPEPPRPSSGNTNSTPSSSRPTPAPTQKRSNIMSLLNDDPPAEKKPEAKPVVPIRHDSPMSATQSMYQPPSQSMYSRRDVVDPGRESHHQSQRGFTQSSYGSPAVQAQNYGGQSTQPYTTLAQHQSQQQLQQQHHLQQQQALQQQQQIQAQGRDQYQQRSYYQENGRSHEPRQMYQQGSTAASPPPAQQSSYGIPRSTYDTPSHTHVGRSPSHSRAASYNVHPNPTNTGPGQALAPSPYAAIRPSGLSQPMSHQQTSTPQHPIYHPGSQGPPSMGGGSRAATAYPTQLTHEQRRAEEQARIQQQRYGTPSHTPPNNGVYGGYPPPP